MVYKWELSVGELKKGCEKGTSIVAELEGYVENEN